jgi:hypothetical protein
MSLFTMYMFSPEPYLRLPTYFGETQPTMRSAANYSGCEPGQGDFARGASGF